jgi:hypothetical protein
MNTITTGLYSNQSEVFYANEKGQIFVISSPDFFEAGQISKIATLPKNAIPVEDSADLDFNLEIEKADNWNN